MGTGTRLSTHVFVLSFLSRLANVDSHSGNPTKTFPFSMLCLL